MKLSKGRVAIQGKIGYVRQQAWIFHGTVRENILFGSTFDERRLVRPLSRGFNKITDVGKWNDDADFPGTGPRSRSVCWPSTWITCPWEMKLWQVVSSDWLSFSIALIVITTSFEIFNESSHALWLNEIIRIFKVHWKQFSDWRKRHQLVRRPEAKGRARQGHLRRPRCAPTRWSHVSGRCRCLSASLPKLPQGSHKAGEDCSLQYSTNSRSYQT